MAPNLCQLSLSNLVPQLVGVVDEPAPMVKFTNNVIKTKIPLAIKHKLNARKRLLKSNKRSTTTEKTDRVKHLSNEIKAY